MNHVLDLEKFASLDKIDRFRINTFCDDYICFLKWPDSCLVVLIDATKYSAGLHKFKDDDK